MPIFTRFATGWNDLFRLVPGREDYRLADTLYELESDPLREPFAEDVGPTLCDLSGAGVAVGILSDIHVDIRPAFAAHIDPDGASWADYVDLWLLSFELGLAKPDPAVFELALDRLGLPAREVLMVGDRGAWDGAAACGITTLVLPPLQSAQDRRLHHVLDLVMPR